MKEQRLERILFFLQFFGVLKSVKIGEFW